MDEQINKMWYVDILESYSALKRENIMNLNFPWCPHLAGSI